MPAEPKKSSGGSTLTRVLSFGKRGKKEEKPAEDGAAPTPRKTSVAGELVRKLSLGKKKSSA